MYFEKHIRNAINNVVSQRWCALTAGIVRMGIVNPIITKLTNIKLASGMESTTAQTRSIQGRILVFYCIFVYW